MTDSTGGGSFRERLESGRFCYGVELVTTRGIVPAGTPAKLAQTGEALLADPRIDWVSITDNPGGNPMLPPDWLARLLSAQKSRLILHLAGKDMNRNAIESAAWRYASEGFPNILALTGDYAKTGYAGQTAPVFDIDSCGIIALLRAMNEGLEVPSRKGGTERLPKTDFHVGAVVSPFKKLEAELLPQYFKLLKKILCGARFVILQVGYDMRKAHEVKLFLARHGVKIPLVGNVYVLTKTVAEMFHRGDIAGCVVSAELLDQCRKYAAGPDKGKAFFRELAAKQLAAFKGMGFAAGYLGGLSKTEDFLEVIRMAEAFGPDDWKAFAKEIQFPQKGEFYLHEKNPATGLGDDDRLNPAYTAGMKNPAPTANVTLNYRMCRLVHAQAFTPGRTGFQILQKVYRFLDKHPVVAAFAADPIERLSKYAMFGCRECGDCALPDCAYLCPLFSCSKNQRNGPCGGSADGRCEVGDKDCLWVRAYERLRCHGEVEKTLTAPLVRYDATLKNTSSWANFYLGRDHARTPQPATPPPAVNPAAAPTGAKTEKPGEGGAKMPLKGLTIIGESINDSVPSTKKLYDANDIAGLLALAKTQDEKGAAYLDVNVGRRPPEFMADMVRKVQGVTAKPLSIDTPDKALAEAGLKAYDKARAGGKMPVINSISAMRLEMLELYAAQPFMPILLVSERVENGDGKPNRTAEETYQTAKLLLTTVRESRFKLQNNQCIIDPGIAPLGTDMEGNLKRLLGALKLIHNDPFFAGVHMSVGLSNFTVMLPPKKADGSPVKGPLESAFLTLAMPLGLDFIIGSTGRKYEILPEGHPALVCLQDILKTDDMEALLRVKEFYS
ncbi:MAG: methylenetetrahydrofolate reductase C-terminal domain-containing protein [Planctomycetota bacterium]